LYFIKSESKESDWHSKSIGGHVAGVQDKAIALNRVTNVLWRSSQLAKKQKDGRALISFEDLQTMYFSTYASGTPEELDTGLNELSLIGEVKITAEKNVLFNLSSLPGSGCI
jgi:hypothetical protein